MTVIVESFDHYCTSEQDCGEEVGRHGASVKLVRKGIWKNADGKIIRLFPSEEKALEEAERLGYEVIA
jgi:hypothetical protein